MACDEDEKRDLMSGQTRFGAAFFRCPNQVRSLTRAGAVYSSSCTEHKEILVLYMRFSSLNYIWRTDTIIVRSIWYTDLNYAFQGMAHLARMVDLAYILPSFHFSIRP